MTPTLIRLRETMTGFEPKVSAQHAIRVELPRSGWVIQTCVNYRMAREVFDGLTASWPELKVQRLFNDRVIEISGLSDARTRTVARLYALAQ